jgi:SAM-dependent methyltransferase
VAWIRDSPNPVLADARRWLDRVNARHPWNHNEHFHGWILRNLPSRRRAALDVGCGTGVLAGKLALQFERVTGIDADAGMAAAATARLANEPQVTIRFCRFEQFAAAASDGEADLITMVELVSSAANPIMGLFKHPRPARPACPARPADRPVPGKPVIPVRDPDTSLAEITASARTCFPGATIRRRLFFRYTLRWDKPPDRDLPARFTSW